MKKSMTKWITVTALMMAFVVASGYIPKLPTPIGNIYWCDGPIIIAALLLDPVGAFLAGGVSMLLYDFMVGSAYMAVPSLIIHGMQAIVVSSLAHYVFGKWDNLLTALVSALAGAVVVIGGYFLQRTFFLADAGLSVALAKMPANFIQEGIGIALALVVVYVCRVKALLKKNDLLPPLLFSK